MLSEASIASGAQSCLAIFERLCALWSSADATITDQVSFVAIKTESSRYNLWANNIAALQDAYVPTSLEYRIREDANACDIVKKTLAYLEESLQLALSIISGERPNETWAIEAKSQADEGVASQSSEIVELYLSIQEAIASLFRLSMIIRKKPEKDEYVKAASRYQIDPTSDIVHVADKYPNTKKGELSWLIRRLGVAITWRRQYLLFRKEHQERMLQWHKIKAGADGNTIWSGTKASTYLPDERAAISESDLEDPIKLILESSHKRARTEYADSSRGKDGAMEFLRTPPLPMTPDGARAQYGAHFECPYCRRLQIIHDKNEWKKHVLSDLKPYVCTFKPCELNMFASQHDWFTHELHFHREQWRCLYCKHQAPTSRSDLIDHLRVEHHDDFIEPKIDDILEKCLVERIDATACPLCTEYAAKLQKINQSSKCDVSLKQFEQHLGVHMQQLALAALPQENIDNNSEASEDDDSYLSMWEKKGLVIREFKAQTSNEISVAVDDVVLIIEDTNGGNWLRVRHLKDGKVGMIPSNHVTSVEKSHSIVPDVELSVDQAGEAGSEANSNLLKRRMNRLLRQDILAKIKKTQTHLAHDENNLVDVQKHDTKILDTPTEMRKKPIRFKDCIGRKFEFPFHLCQTWAGMEELIKHAFFHVEVIGSHVAEGHYDLVGPNGEILFPQVWETMIEPGWAITMHMWPLPEQPENQQPDGFNIPNNNPSFSVTELIQRFLEGTGSTQ